MISRQTAVILAQDELGDKNETRDSAGILAMNCKMLGDQGGTDPARGGQEMSRKTLTNNIRNFPFRRTTFGVPQKGRGNPHHP
jgi:hypothetical protein